MGYTKRLADQWTTVLKITTDTIGVGDVVTSGMRNMGLRQTWGITFTAQTKTDILENLHRMLAEKRLKLVYDPELIGEMNCETYEMSKSGQLLFSHPNGTWDDRLWALALACHGLRYRLSVTKFHPFAAVGKAVKFWPPRPRVNMGPRGTWFFP